MTTSSMPATATNTDPVRTAVRDSVPIALGYFVVSLALGVYAAQIGMSAVLAGVMSAVTMSSSGEFAGMTMLSTGGAYAQLAIGVVLVNARYVLMAISLGQRLEPNTGVGRRAVMAWGITDEVYALAMARPRITFRDYVASMMLPILGWTAGTVVGALIGEILPDLLTSAAGVLLYAMFVAIVIPSTRGSRAMLGVVLGAAALGTALSFVPWLDSGWRTILVTVVVAGVAATIAPHPQPDLPGHPAAASEVHA